MKRGGAIGSWTPNKFKERRMEQLLWPERLSFLREETLYKNTKGAYFIYGEGGPARHSRSTGQNKLGRRGKGIHPPMTKKRRKEWARSISRSRGIRSGIRRSSKKPEI